jgi:tRNA-dependent cyclodipeptide synthase
MALGYDQTKASSKARLGSNRLKNHSQKIIGTNTKVEIVNWSKRIANNPFYQNNLNLISELYRVNQEFQTDAEEATKKVLMKKSDRAISEEDIKIGTKYLLEELAFVLSSPDIFEVQSTVYMYHRNWPIYEKLVNGEYDNKPRNNLGFLLVNEK